MANILVVGPHPDDQELGMGGTIIKLAEQGHNILILDITNGEPTPHGSLEEREKEWTLAAKIMGAPRQLLGLKNREVLHTLDARHAVAGIIREHQAEIIFLPFEEDAHPDHRAVTRIVEDARFDAKLTKIDLPGEPIYPRWMIYYYCTHLRWVANPTFCVDITEQMEKKIDAIKAYHTQFVVPEKNRPIVDWLRSMNAYMGSRIGVPYAEPFFTKEPLGLNGLGSLVGI
ncbi:glucosamine-6-phosphate deaminase-like protein [Poriferisphaera corsica]|uniref:Glucosamine-6-phosphate deaminase-like protein n=1 Tax=Poriferisphaera corsica TaxID=2528020 RepID=A0A517YRY6_9BACT|nr:PIG-L family deacetylase [Poriferisphaera corsica]QDU32984.1 glucosamine-6-phosphate deaminase-like protein [Poriferisphaera corsica]